MSKYITFLRAINVGGNNVRMERLRELFETAGFTAVETFIASGNVIFDSARRSASLLEDEIGRVVSEGLGYTVSAFVRTPAEVAAVAAREPFGARAADTALHIGFTTDAIAEEARQRILGFRTEAEDFHVEGREVYWLRTGLSSDSKFSNAALERVIGGRATFRNSTTVAKLSAKYPSSK